MKLRTGFIGLGAMGMSHLKSVSRLCGEQAEIVGFCEGREANIKEGLSLAPEAKVFRKPEDLISSNVEVIFVSTPNFTHAPLALQVLSADKHLFLEKPVGITPLECSAVLDAAERSKKVVMIGHELRHSPYFQKIKDMVAAGEIGKPQMVWTREFRGPFQKKTGDWIQDERRSGGCLVDKNCHHFDLMNWWVGGRPRYIAGFGGCAVNRVLEGPHQVHDHATVSFEYDTGARGTLQLCMFALDFPHEDLEMGVVGTGGMLLTRISRIEILQWKRGSNQREPIIHPVHARHGEGWGSHLGFDEIHQNFFRCILEKRAPLTSVRNCIDGTMAAIAAEESIKKGVVVDFERWYGTQV